VCFHAVEALGLRRLSNIIQLVLNPTLNPSFTVGLRQEDNLSLNFGQRLARLKNRERFVDHIPFGACREHEHPHQQQQKNKSSHVATFPTLRKSLWFETASKVAITRRKVNAAQRRQMRQSTIATGTQEGEFGTLWAQ
jgi:hypothetical protein